MLIDPSKIAVPELMEGTVLDHLAIAVKDLEQAIQVYTDLGITFSPEREIVESQGVKTAFASIDQNGHLELLESLNPQSPVGQFLQKKGEGIHHICFRVSNVKELCQELKSKGYRFIYELPVPGARNCLVNFLHPKSANGVLIELSQSLEQNLGQGEKGHEF